MEYHASQDYVLKASDQATTMPLAALISLQILLCAQSLNIKDALLESILLENTFCPQCSQLRYLDVK